MGKVVVPQPSAVPSPISEDGSVVHSSFGIRVTHSGVKFPIPSIVKFPTPVIALRTCHHHHYPPISIFVPHFQCTIQLQQNGLQLHLLSFAFHLVFRPMCYPPVFVPSQ